MTGKHDDNQEKQNDDIRPMKFIFGKRLPELSADSNDENTIYFSWLDGDEEERG